MVFYKAPFCQKAIEAMYNNKNIYNKTSKNRLESVSHISPFLFFFLFFFFLLVSFFMQVKTKKVEGLNANVFKLAQQILWKCLKRVPLLVNWENFPSKLLI